MRPRTSCRGDVDKLLVGKFYAPSTADRRRNERGEKIRLISPCKVYYTLRDENDSQLQTKLVINVSQPKIVIVTNYVVRGVIHNEPLRHRSTRTGAPVSPWSEPPRHRRFLGALGLSAVRVSILGQPDHRDQWGAQLFYNSWGKPIFQPL